MSYLKPLLKSQINYAATDCTKEAKWMQKHTQHPANDAIKHSLMWVCVRARNIAEDVNAMQRNDNQ